MLQRLLGLTVLMAIAVIKMLPPWTKSTQQWTPMMRTINPMPQRVGAVLAACTLSGSTGVYFEKKLLKSSAAKPVVGVVNNHMNEALAVESGGNNNSIKILNLDGTETDYTGIARRNTMAVATFPILYTKPTKATGYRQVIGGGGTYNCPSSLFSFGTGLCGNASRWRFNYGNVMLSEVQFSNLAGDFH